MDLLKWLPLLLLVYPLLWAVRGLLAAKAIAGLRFAPDQVKEADLQAMRLHRREVLAPVLDELARLGFTARQAWDLVSGSGADFDSYAVEAAHPIEATRAVLKIRVTAEDFGQGWVAFSTLLMDGRELMTRNHEEPVVIPLSRSVTVETLERLSVVKLLERHRARVAEAAKKGVMPLALDAEAARAREQALADEGLADLRETDMVAEADGRLRLKFGAAFKRGLEVMRRDAARVKASAACADPARAYPLSDAAQAEFEWEFYRHVHALQRGHLAQLPKAILLLVSLTAFTAVLAWQMSVSAAVVLVVALVVHEVGHLIGMWIFGHRNTEMLFLPFFGGAAISRDDKVLRPWQHLVILFLGPLPGVFVGVALVALGLGDATSRLLEAGLVVLVFNLFNLLPLLPLDGGRVLDIAVLARFPALRTIFAGVSGLVLVGIALTSGDVVLGLIGGFMLMRVPLAWKSAQLVRSLRSVLPPGADEETAVRSILPHLREPAWGKMPLAGRVTQAGGLQRMVRLPHPGWGTLLFAVVGFTSPLWLGIPLLWGVVSLQRVANIRTAEAHVEAVKAKLQHGARPSAPESIPEDRNAAIPYREALANMDVAERETAVPQGTTGLEALRLLREAARRPQVDWSAVGSSPVITKGKHLRTLRRLAVQSSAQLEIRTANAAAEIAADGLRLERHLWSFPEWRWADHITARRELWSALEAAVSAGGTLRSASHTALVETLDEEAYLDFAARVLIQSSVDQFQRVSDSHLGGAVAGGWLARALTALDPFRGQWALNEAAETALLHEHLAQARRGEWRLPTLPSPDERRIFSKGKATAPQIRESLPEGRVAGTLREVGDEVARGRLTIAGLRAMAHAQRTGALPGSLAEIHEESAAPRHPVTGEILAWRNDETHTLLEFTLAREESKSGTGNGSLRWRLPKRK